MAQQQTIDITNFSLEQLNTMKQQFEEEIQVLSSSFQQLKVAAARFHESKDTLDSITPENKGKTTYIPLTSSLYVPAELTNTETVLVDIGTGYYAKKSVKDAQSYLDRKIKMINDNIDQLSQALNIKKKNFESVLLVMQNKIQQIEEQQAQQQIKK